MSNVIASGISDSLTSEKKELIRENVYLYDLEAASGGKNKIFYDDQGNPNVMVWINKFNCEDVNAAILDKTGQDMNLGTGTHPAFIKDGVEIRGFWYGKYQASTINSVNSGCSVISSVQPRVNVSYDTAKSYLLSTDWIIAKIAETNVLGGDIDELTTKYADELEAREVARNTINELES